MKTLKERLIEKREKRLRPAVIVLTIIAWTVLIFLIGKCNGAQAQSLSERIDKIEWVDPISHTTFFGWEAVFHYSTHNGRAWKVVAGSLTGVVIIDNIKYRRDYGCKLSWWQRHKAKRQFKKRRR